jgi:hypothetical protein
VSGASARGKCSNAECRRKRAKRCPLTNWGRDAIDKRDGSSSSQRTSLVLGPVVAAILLGLAAALLTSASIAWGAPGHFTALAYPAGLHGTAVTGKSNSITVGETTYSCASTALAGKLTEKATDLTLEPTHDGCVKGVEPSTVTWNGCDYVFHAGEGSEAEFPVTTDLDCPEGKSVEIHSYASEADHKSGSSNCTVAFAKQTGLKG